MTDDGRYTSSINFHANAKKKHFLKYLSFLQKNNDFTFIIKKGGRSVYFLSILYGCETWYCSAYGNLETMYMGIVKALSAVRQQVVTMPVLLSATCLLWKLLSDTTNINI